MSLSSNFLNHRKSQFIKSLSFFWVFNFFLISFTGLSQNSGVNEIDSLLNQSKTLRASSYQLALDYADKALKYAEEGNDVERMAKANLYKAHAAAKLGKQTDAISGYNRALQLYRKTGDSLGVGKSYMELGNLYRTLDKSDEAIDYLFKSLGRYKAAGDSSGVGDAFLCIAIVHGIAKNYDEAERYLLLAQEVFKNIAAEERQIRVLSNLGTLYNVTKKTDEAIAVTEKVRDYYAINGPPTHHALALHNLALQHGAQGNYQKSIEYNTLALKIYEELGDSYQLCGIELTLAKANAGLGQLDKAEELALNALKRMPQLKSHSLEYRIYRALYDIYLERSDYKTALDYRLKYEEAKDSAFQAEKQKQIAEINTRYETELKERELEKLGAKNELSQLQLKKKQNQQYILWGALGLVLVIALLLFNQFRVKQKNNRLLRDKNQLIQKNLDEKEVLLKEIHHRVKNNLQFISSLLNLQSRHVSDQNTLTVLNDCKNRVNSMAMVHQRLYQEENLKGVYMPLFVNNLLDSLNHSYRKHLTKLNSEVDIDPLYLDVDTAIPIGLILNELITNVFKYAFADLATGKVQISLKEKGEILLLQVKDNGKGLPPDFDVANLNSFGLQLVESLSQKLKGKLKIESEKGTQISLSIKQYKTS